MLLETLGIKLAYVFDKIGYYNGAKVALANLRSDIMRQPTVLETKAAEILAAIADSNESNLATTYQSGFALLSEGMRAKSEQVRRDSFMLARSRFATLIAASRSKAEYRAAGYYGTYIYYGLNEEHQLANEQRLMSLVDHPLPTVKLFGRLGFPAETVDSAKKLYAERTSMKWDELNIHTQNDFAKFMAELQKKGKWTGQGIALSTVGTVGGMLLGGVICTLTSGLATPWALQVVGAGIGAGAPGEAKIPEEELKRIHYRGYGLLQAWEQYETKLSDSARIKLETVRSSNPTAYSRLALRDS